MIKWIKYHLGFLSVIKRGSEYYVTYTRWRQRRYLYFYCNQVRSTEYAFQGGHLSLGSAQATSYFYLQNQKAKRLNSKLTIL